MTYWIMIISGLSIFSLKYICPELGTIFYFGWVPVIIGGFYLFKGWYGKKIYFSSIVIMLAEDEEICEHTKYIIGGYRCCVNCKHNRKFNLKERWVRCNK